MEPATLRTAVVLPAAGRGARFGSSENKIWVEIGGQSVLARTIAAFDSHLEIDLIVLVAGAEEVKRVQQASASFSKVRAVVAGGATRAESVRCGLDAIGNEADIVLVHDAARPLISPKLISRVIAGVMETGAAIPGLALSDTVKRMDANGLVHATIPRAITVDGATLFGLTTVQTPQGARLEHLRAAYTAFPFATLEPTDEASLLEHAGYAVRVVPGDPANLKITRPDDVTQAEELLSVERRALSNDTSFSTLNARRSTLETRTGFGYDVHAFAEPEAGRKLFLGGIEIPHDRGLEGHSDADVLLHAVCDALLGAASLGDIGILFPNTDETYRGIASLRLLEVVNERLHEAGWRVVNIDATMVAEAPKLMPHRIAMQETMAACLKIEANRVSVKATTSEKMGFVGRREGMACWAVATVVST